MLSRKDQNFIHVIDFEQKNCVLVSNLWMRIVSFVFFKCPLFNSHQRFKTIVDSVVFEKRMLPSHIEQVCAITQCYFIIADFWYGRLYINNLSWLRRLFILENGFINERCAPIKCEFSSEVFSFFFIGAAAGSDFRFVETANDQETL